MSTSSKNRVADILRKDTMYVHGVEVKDWTGPNGLSSPTPTAMSTEGAFSLIREDGLYQWCVYALDGECWDIVGVGQGSKQSARAALAAWAGPLA
jgi:hypothetical protein